MKALLFFRPEKSLAYVIINVMKTANDKSRVVDTRISDVRAVKSPQLVCEEVLLSDSAENTVYETRRQIVDTLNKTDDRLLVVCGPCSIHDVEAAIEYAQKLNALREHYSDDLLIIMRVYFEKPRTTVGWKGLINDPNIDESFDINKGVVVARRLLLEISEMGLGAGTEFLDIISPQYISDLVSWGAIGARTTESQLHRELCSALSCPVGLKNGTRGGIQIAVDGVMSAAHPHHFLTITKAGHSAIYTTSGNPDCHVILRGGLEPNYEAKYVDETCALLKKAGLDERVMIDFSHANSKKQFERQMIVADDVASQIAAGDKRITGVMIESHLIEGNQKIAPRESLTYGQSITDACIGWSDTEKVLEQLALAVQKRRSA